MSTSPEENDRPQTINVNTEDISRETMGSSNVVYDPSDKREVILEALDDKTVKISANAAKLSEMLRVALASDDDDDDNDGDDENQEPKKITLVKVRGQCLEKVCEFLTRHVEEKFKGVILPLLGNDFNENIKQEWYRNFMSEMDRDMVYQVLGAANYMNIRPLLELACLRVTFELADKSADEIYDLLDLPKNLTPEQQAKEYQERAWIFDESNHERARQAEDAAST